MAEPDPAFRAMAQAMADGLARKHRLGLSDEDMRREMLDRFRLRRLVDHDHGSHLRGVQRDLVGLIKQRLVAATDRQRYRVTNGSVLVVVDQGHEPWRWIRVADRADAPLAYVEVGPVPAEDPAYLAAAAMRDATTVVVGMFAAEVTILLPCGPVVVDVAGAVSEGFTAFGWDRLLPDDAM